MPAQQRLRPDEECSPGISRQQPAERGQQQPVTGREPRPGNLSTQNRQLVTQDENLQLLRTLAPAEQHDELKQTADDSVRQRPEQAQPPEGGKADASATGARANPISRLSTRRSNMCTPHGLEERLEQAYAATEGDHNRFERGPAQLFGNER
jgi:hypothetical protein